MDIYSFIPSSDIGSEGELVRGFCVDEEGHLYDYSSSYDLEQLEYYHGNLSGHQRLLHYVSVYQKGEIRLTKFLAIQYEIMLEKQMDKNWHPNDCKIEIPEYLTIGGQELNNKTVYGIRGEPSCF